MRWENLTIEQDETARLPGYCDDAVVRHFDAPDAIPTRFYEIRAKSILNKVPEASQMPFRWTINPYRGCSHACSYCQSPDTPVLLEDGSTRAIADLRVGEMILGTQRRGGERVLTPTAVVDRWRTRKVAYRLELRDGRVLHVSADHRLLSRNGWASISGPAAGHERLGPGCELVGLAEDLWGEAIAHGFATTAVRLAGTRVAVRQALSVASVRDVGEMALFDITTGTGDFIANGVVSHNCFARPTHTYLDFDAGRDFEREIVVKVNAPERLRSELARPSWKGEHIALGTNTDPYQWVEGRYQLMRGIWQAMIDARNPGSVLTKSPLLLRDLDLMTELNRRAEFGAALSIPTIEEKAWRATEPHTPSPRARLEAVATLTAAGIRTGVLVAPLMPGINDDPEQVREVLRLAAEAGAAYVTGIALHLRGEVRRVFMEWLTAHRPDLVPRYRELYRRGAYAPVGERRRLAGLLRGPDLSPWERGRAAPEAAPRTREPEQVRLFDA